MENSDKHLKDLADIRQMMERSSKFLSLSGWSGICAGIFALLGAFGANSLIQSSQGSSLRLSLESSLILLALMVLLLALGSALFFSWRKARRQGSRIWAPLTRKLLFSMAVPLLTGGIFTLILLRQGQVQIVAGSTLIFYGLALVNAGRFINREAVILGVAEILLGISATVWPSYGLWIWGMGFGVFHILYGLVLFRKYDRPASHG